MIRLAILGSTRGTLMLNLIDAIQQKSLAADIRLVISNKADAMILENAKRHGLHTQYVDSSHLTREMYDHKISNLLKEQMIDLVVLIGYMRILSKEFVDAWKNKIINVHPSLLPAYAGKMDRQVHQAVLAAKEKESGCTVHYVTEEVDAGPVLIQKKCVVLSTDTVDELRARVQALEGTALIEAIKQLSQV